LALCSSGAALRLPLEEGGGEDACAGDAARLRDVRGEVRLLGIVPAADRRAAIEVWLVRPPCGATSRDVAPGGLQCSAPQDIVARWAPGAPDALTLAALAVAPARSSCRSVARRSR